MTISIFRTHARLLRLAAVPVLALGLVGAAAGSAFACITPPPPPPPPKTTSCVNLGAAASFAVLAAATVTNTGPSVISGNLGVSPGTAVTGFPPGQVINGSIHSADTATAAAKVSLAKAYTDTANKTPSTNVPVELGGKTFGPGVYNNTTLGITGTVTLDAHGNSNSVFIFQSASTLITASSSAVKLINGAKASNVCWQVGSSATLGTYSSFAGTIMAYASITDTTGTSVNGRLLVETAAVTLDTNKVTLP